MRGTPFRDEGKIPQRKIRKKIKKEK